MLALKMQINEEPVLIAGADDLGVLSAMISAVGQLGINTKPYCQDESWHCTATLGGLTRRFVKPNEHVRWIEQRPLNIGDVVRIELTETESAPNPPITHTAEQIDDEHEYFKQCKQAYFELKDKYENSGDAQS